MGVRQAVTQLSITAQLKYRAPACPGLADIGRQQSSRTRVIRLAL